MMKNFLKTLTKYMIIFFMIFKTIFGLILIKNEPTFVLMMFINVIKVILTLVWIRLQFNEKNSFQMYFTICLYLIRLACV